MDYLYLHGFASSPQSAKAQFCHRQLVARGRSLHIPDLNRDDFAHLTLTRQIHQATTWLAERDRVTLIGSSLGGLTAAWVAQQPEMQAKVERLILLAPAFQFLHHWLPRLGADTLTQWQTTGWRSVYHYGLGASVPLHYHFVVDAQSYCR